MYVHDLRVSERLTEKRARPERDELCEPGCLHEGLPPHVHRVGRIAPWWLPCNRRELALHSCRLWKHDGNHECECGHVW